MKNSNDNHFSDAEHKMYQRDKTILNFLKAFVIAILGLVAILCYQVLMPKQTPPTPIEDNLAEPIIYMPPDNRKELILENTND